MHPPANDVAILAIERPHPRLWTYYWVSLLAFPPALPILILPAYFRYHTLRYKFTDEGISMSWGILFRREIIIQYARIQDIHLRSNLLERWLGLAKIPIQTASGNASAEMTLEGLCEYEAVRDFLYSRMRGVKDHARAPVTPASPSTPVGVAGSADAELAATLREIAAELRQLRHALPPRTNAPQPEHRDV